MSHELIKKLTQDPGLHSAYIEDAEMRDMVIAWAAIARNEGTLATTREQKCAVNEKYITLIEDMMVTNPELYKRFSDYIANTFVDATIWSEPADRIRKTLLPK